MQYKIENKINTNGFEEYFQTDPLRNFYNLNGLTDVILTCDIDWAPEFAIEKVLETIEEFGFKINFFATHKSELLLKSSEYSRVGIHPNFTRLKTNIQFEDEVKRLKDIYQDSIGTRSHRNFFGQNIADIVSENGLIYDASVFLWNQSFCQAHLDYNGMIRFSYCWEDGIHLDTNTPLEISNVNINSPGLKIINIHPVLFYLNTITDDERRVVTSKYSDLTIAPQSEFDLHVNKNFGIGDFFIEILKYCKSKNVTTHFLDDLALQALEGQPINKHEIILNN